MEINNNISNKKIKKAVIPAAGFGTRFLPATKAIAKEMLPIVDTPTIEYIVREAMAAGIEEFLIIINDYKESIKEHFGHNFPLESFLKEKNNIDALNTILELPNSIKVNYVVQKEQKGLGHAISFAKEFCNGEDFAVLLGDDIVVNKKYPAIKQLCDFYEHVQSTIVGVQEVENKDTKLYGIVDPKGDFVNHYCLIKSMVEKPDPKLAPSNYAVLGRYILSNSIFDKLESQVPGKGGEIQLTDAIQRLISEENVYAYEFEGVRYDVGSKIGFVKATIDFALDRDDLKEEIIDFIKNKNL